jgi:20S proteasome subunit beta 1
MNAEDPCVHTAAYFINSINYSNKDNLTAGMICGGWDPVKGAQLYNIPLGGGLFEQDIFIDGK